MWEVYPEEMSTEEIETLINKLQAELEHRSIDEVERLFDRAFNKAHEEGYRVFFEGIELFSTDIYIGTEAP